MNRKLFTVTLIALLALLLSVGGATGQEPNPEGEPQPQGDVSITSTVNSRISYQGMLKEDGAPVTGSRDMRFRLYSDGSCTTRVAGIVKNGVTVTDGLFSVELHIKHSDFNGQGLWLEVEVGGTAIGCQEILPVPYALSLRPGAVISDTNSKIRLNRYRPAHFWPYKSYKYGINAGVSGSYDYAYGVYGVADTTETVGVAYGLYGSATADSGTAYGVYGESDSASGTGVYGTAPNTGVEGHASADSGFTYGIYGQSDSTWGRGVYGHTSADSGVTYGVVGLSESAEGRGVFGYADADSGATYGVYGKSRSAEGAGVYATNWHSGGTAPDLVLGGTGSAGALDDGRIHSAPTRLSSDLLLVSNDDVSIYLNSDGGSEDSDLEVFDQDNNRIFNVDESGMTRVQVLQITGGSDLAEPFEIAGAESIAPGMVVAIDPEHPGQLRIADRAYDRTVAGCVSGANGINPGLTMEQEGTVAEGSLPVALSGRVYCWADASYGPIQPGDLLTTSDTPGHVMKVTDYERAQGAIIGKAMSALGGEQGLILVLVSLQ